MITQGQINNLKDGDKVIFVSNGGVLSAQIGNVFTFSNWWEEDNPLRPGKHYFQCRECHEQGNHVHQFRIYDTEIFDEAKHKNFVMMSVDKLKQEQEQFIKRYGA